MSGASTELFAAISRPPSTSIVTSSGSIQNLRRTRMKRHSSVGKDISALLELLAQVGRHGAIARQPVAIDAGFELEAQGVVPQRAHQQRDRRYKPVEHDAEHDWIDDARHQVAKRHPESQRRSQQCWPPEANGYTRRRRQQPPRSRLAAAYQRPQCRQSEDGAEQQAERTLAGNRRLLPAQFGFVRIHAFGWPRRALLPRRTSVDPQLLQLVA